METDNRTDIRKELAKRRIALMASVKESTYFDQLKKKAKGSSLRSILIAPIEVTGLSTREHKYNVIPL